MAAVATTSSELDEAADGASQPRGRRVSRTGLNTHDELPEKPGFLEAGVTPVSARLRRIKSLSGSQLASNSPYWGDPDRELKHRVWMFVNEPGSSPAAKYFALLILGLIVLNTMTLLAETMPEFSGVSQFAWDAFEAGCMVIFLVEIGMRQWSSTSWMAYFVDPLNDLDVLIVVFWVLGLVMAASGFGDVRVIRLLRLVRIARVFKLSRFSGTIHLLLEVITSSTQSLVLLLFFVFVTIVLFSSAMFYIEGGDQHDELYRERGLPGNPFTSIPATVYWCVVTVTSIGYGDIFPLTDVGRMVAVTAVVVGSVVVAMPLSVISTHFLKATRTLEKETAEKLARTGSTFALDRLSRVASMRAPRLANVVVPHEPPLHSMEWAEREMLRLLDATEAKWDKKIDLLVSDLTELHRVMLDNGMLTAKLDWR
uniref:Ion transport domain-containing protein n=1 Tax=Bicosoecida sp. CB-2014 TaxID=1486930 RepID=A0A7S1GCL1_9STRA|mmetsp:Transcript_28006/g.96816  ORF Transcript_28006/g.96816 Transcript_28006/m.96816 type:complete len:425 (+) Transcript_28006:365-1639(+)